MQFLYNDKIDKISDVNIGFEKYITKSQLRFDLDFLLKSQTNK